ncbi:DUF6573 family protein [Actinomadura rayongensis]|uniref:Uncharacterized protein n=1 Tax=Actinomadura rayongensis TaxID=1429076 RepID=A0A6I4WA47_9ACTN|nr:DUF6573 family protein [Actinomadura rayongensis]MXQ67719.1 hypothetical protein [Actinomadura rayongensis]
MTFRTPDEPTEHGGNEHDDIIVVFFGSVLHAYTRRDMLADGSLVAVPEPLARMGGFFAPVAITRAAWSAVADPHAAPAPDDPGRPLTGYERAYVVRLLRVANFAVHRDETGSNEVQFRFSRADEPLYLHVGPGDDGDIVFTIMTGADR